MASRIDKFAHLLGTIPDEKIAEMADVQPATVTAYRRRLETGGAEGHDDDDVAAPVPAAPVPAASAPPTPAPEPAPAPRAAPRARPAGELVIELDRSVPWVGTTPRGRRVSGRFARSRYRGKMARKVLATLGADHPAVEILSGR